MMGAHPWYAVGRSRLPCDDRCARMHLCPPRPHYSQHLAVEAGNCMVAKNLVESGAVVTPPQTAGRGNAGFRAIEPLLHTASKRGAIDCMLVLLDAFPDIIDVKDSILNAGGTALIAAAAAEQIRSMETLISCGANTSAVDIMGQSVWDYAASYLRGNELESLRTDAAAAVLRTGIACVGQLSG